MKIKLGLIIIIAAGAAGCSGSESSTEDAANEESDISASPDGYVLAPGGFEFHQSCVVHLDDGDTVDGETITKQDGRVVQLPPCRYPRRGGHARPDQPQKESSLTPDEGAPTATVNGWVDSAWANVSGGGGEYSGTWHVPGAPSNRGGQTIFFFNSTENQNEDEIIQPVLQWGPSAAGGGKYWAIASWHVGKGYAFTSRLVRTTPGHLIKGSAKRVHRYCGSSMCWQWDVTTSDATAGSHTTLTASVVKQVWAQGAVLEAYGVNACSQLPGTSLRFSDAAVYDESYRHIARPGWERVVNNPSPHCGYGVAIDSPSSFTLRF